MYKKIIAFLLALVISAVPLLGGAGTVHGAEASSNDMETLIEKQIRAFADSIDKSNADDDAALALAGHGMSGRGKTLKVGKSHPLTALIMNSETAQQALIRTCKKQLPSCSMPVWQLCLIFRDTANGMISTVKSVYTIFFHRIGTGTTGITR